MLQQIYTTKFTKDIIRCSKRGKDLSKIEKIINHLSQGQKLDPKYKDHNLIGNYKNRRECHIEPDWLLIYKLDGENIIFERTGTHSDLF